MSHAVKRTSRSTRSRILAAASLGVVIPLVVGTAAAQAPAQEAPKPAPKYKPLRQDEDWSALAKGNVAADVFDPIKYVSLRDDGSIWASFGGEARLRLENWDGYRFGAPATADSSDLFLLTRARVHGDVHIGPQVRLFAEGITAWVTDRDLVGGRRTLDVDSIDLAQGFLDVKAPLVDGATLTLRPGRQQFLFGRQRLVSPLPWANTLRAWDGISAIFDSENYTATALLTQFAPVQKYDFNDVNPAIDFAGVYATRKPGAGRMGMDAYALRLDRKTATFNGTTGHEKRWTVGARVWEGPSPGKFDYDVEGAWQFGEIGGGDVSAFMVGAVAGYSIESDLQPRVYVGFDYGSGDNRSGAGVQTFNQLFPLGHAYFGMIDTIGRQNIIDVNLGGDLKVASAVKTGLEAHAFWLADKNDALYDAGGNVLRAGGTATSNQVGFEIDWTASWQVDRHLNASVGVGYFAAGDMIEQSGPNDDTVFAYAQALYLF